MDYKIKVTNGPVIFFVSPLLFSISTMIALDQCFPTFSGSRNPYRAKKIFTVTQVRFRYLKRCQFRWLVAPLELFQGTPVGNHCIRLMMNTIHFIIDNNIFLKVNYKKREKKEN